MKLLLAKWYRWAASRQLPALPADPPDRHDRDLRGLLVDRLNALRRAFTEQLRDFAVL
jgi:hypothetical protein